MNILILGGCGFIGSYVVNTLLEEHSVTVLDRAASPSRNPHASVRYLSGDFASEDVLKDALKNVDCVVHCACTTVPSTSNVNPQLDVESNVVGTLSVLDAMREQHVEKIIFLSSGGTVYGIPEYLPVNELHPLHPICSYGVTKVAIENYLLMYQHLYGIRATIIRPSNPFGERQFPSACQGVIPNFIKAACSDMPIDIWGDGSVVRDFFHVSDLARLLKLTVESDQYGVFNAGYGEGISLNQLVEMIGDMLGTTLHVRHSESRSYDVPKIILDIQKSTEIFGWKPNVSMEEGVLSYIQWFKRLQL